MKWKNKWAGLLSWIKVTVTFLLQARATALFTSGIWGGGNLLAKIGISCFFIIIIITKERL
jgi:hypothetical protein